MTLPAFLADMGPSRRRSTKLERKENDCAMSPHLSLGDEERERSESSKQSLGQFEGIAGS